jgi:hypothetical protein
MALVYNPSMPAPRRINASKIVDLRAAGVTDVIIGWSVGLDGALVVLACKEAPEYLRRNEFTIHVICDGVCESRIGP